MSEATTSASAETTPQGTSSGNTETAETTSAEESTAGVSTERQETDSAVDSEDTFEANVNLDEVPKEYRAEVEKHVKTLEKSFKSAYTKKSQQRAAEVKAAQALADAKAKELQATFSQIEEVLQDPKKYEAYRSLYGKNGQQQTSFDVNNLPPEVQTVGDLVKYMQQMNTAQLSALEQKLKHQTTEQILADRATNRWDSALAEMRAEDPKFKKYEKLVINSLRTDSKYVPMYKHNNEKEVLKAALDDFKSMIREDLEEVKEKTLKEVTKKSAATTSTPGKTVSTTPSRASSKEEIIARVKRMVGE